nr:MAG TPA: hypothetical protein [Caudoviricetes sp.]DAO30332.1 MAG TPA: hypothetical protein [Caudoviricetes sp.]
MFLAISFFVILITPCFSISFYIISILYIFIFVNNFL